MEFVSRGGKKLEYAIEQFGISIQKKICADFGASTGGFVDCLLQHGAHKVYAVEKGKGQLEWKLRTNKRVVVLEGQNAMHIQLPELVDSITIDTSWTRLEKIIPNALANLKEGGSIIALVKPQYEADKKLLIKGKLQEEFVESVVHQVKERIEQFGVMVVAETASPIVGGKGGNVEYLFYIRRL